MLSGKGTTGPSFVQQTEMEALQSYSTKQSRNPCRDFFSTHGPVLQMRLTLEETDEQRSLLLSYRSLLRGMRHSAVTMEALVRALRNSNPGVSEQFSLKTHPNTTNTHHQNTQAAFCLQAMPKHEIPFCKVLYNLEENQQRYLNA